MGLRCCRPTPTAGRRDGGGKRGADEKATSKTNLQAEWCGGTRGKLGEDQVGKWGLGIRQNDGLQCSKGNLQQNNRFFEFTTGTNTWSDPLEQGRVGLGSASQGSRGIRFEASDHDVFGPSWTKTGM